MAKTIDTLSRKYMQDNEHFADAFNFFLFHGKQVIKPGELEERDPSELAAIFLGKLPETVQKYRDVLKLWAVKESPYGICVLLGMEAQTLVHYAMPVRNGLYDFLQYSGQAEQIAKKHRKENDRGSHAEFLSGLRKDDKLVPVITLVLCLDSSEWDGPMSLHEMLDISDESLLRFIPDYRINLISPYTLTDEDFDKFTTELKNVLKVAKYKDDSSEQFDKIIHSDSSFENIGIDTLNLISSITNKTLRNIEGKEEGKYDMCRAIEELERICKAEGKAEGYVNALSDIGMKKEEIVEKIQTRFGFTPEEARKQVEMYL